MDTIKEIISMSLRLFFAVVVGIHFLILVISLMAWDGSLFIALYNWEHIMDAIRILAIFCVMIGFSAHEP